MQSSPTQRQAANGIRHRTIGDCLYTTVTMNMNIFHLRKEFSVIEIFREQINRKSVKKRSSSLSCRWRCECSRSVSACMYIQMGTCAAVNRIRGFRGVARPWTVNSCRLSYYSPAIVRTSGLLVQMIPTVARRRDSHALVCACI